MIRDIALKQQHIDLGAKMVEFAGYLMPLQYSGLIDEHHCVREKIGVFDVSHMGEFLIEGENALDLVQYITSNDASKLKIGDAQYSCFPNDKGGIVDDLICYRIKETTYLLVVNASNIEKDWKWVEQQNESIGAEIRNLSDNYSLLAIQGPKAVEAMQSLTSVDLSAMKFYTFKVADFAGIEHVIISATGYTGAGGFEIYCKNTEVEQVWNKVLEAGSSYGIKPAGLAARDTLRLEMGYCLYGNDINETTSPIEAGLGWITKFTKEFINSDSLKKQKETGVSKKLVGFELIERGIPRQGYKILDENDKEIGEVTSGTMSPSLSKSIGMGYVAKENSAIGNEVYIQIRNKNIKGKIVKMPFYKNNL